MKLRARQPFYGDPEDAALLQTDQPTAEPLGGAVAEMGTIPVVEATAPPKHPDYCEKGIDQPLGLIPHRGANRQQRLAAVANFEAEGADRRELWQQRQRQRRGKLDPELRRLQRRKAEQQ